MTPEMTISVDVRLSLSRQPLLPYAILTSAPDDTIPEPRMSYVGTQTQSHRPDTGESAFSMTDEEPHIYEEGNSTFRDDRPTEGTWGEGRNQGDQDETRVVNFHGATPPAVPRLRGTLHVMLISRSSWTEPGARGGGDEYPTPAVTGALPQRC